MLCWKGTPRDAEGVQLFHLGSFTPVSFTCLHPQRPVPFPTVDSRGPEYSDFNPSASLWLCTEVGPCGWRQEIEECAICLRSTDRLFLNAGASWGTSSSGGLSMPVLLQMEIGPQDTIAGAEKGNIMDKPEALLGFVECPGPVRRETNPE